MQASISLVLVAVIELGELADLELVFVGLQVILVFLLALLVFSPQGLQRCLECLKLDGTIFDSSDLGLH